MKKQAVINVLNDFPKEFSLDDLFEKLIVIQKIEEGLEDVKKGKTIPHEKIKKEAKKWLK
jgi:hypothetical protein